MANTINSASKYERELVETFIDNSYIAPFVTTNVKWLDAKNFHFTVMTTAGYKNHNIEGGWNRQPINQEDVVYTLTVDRDVEFFMDRKEVDESNLTASIGNISNTFEKTQAAPEKDAYFFSKVATTVPTDLKSSTATSAYTADNVFSKFVTFIGKVRRYRNKGLVVYIRPEIMDLLAISKELTHNIEVTSIVQNGRAIETRITQINGVPIVEVVDDDRFYDKFNFDNGFKIANGAHKINMLAATPLTTKLVPKIESIYMFAPGDHTDGDGYLYQNRAHYDVFVFPNGKDNKIDSIAVDLNTTAESGEQ